MSRIITCLNIAESKYGALLFYLGISLLLVFHGWYEFPVLPEALRCFYFSISLFCCFLFLTRIILLLPKHPGFVAGVLSILAFLCFVYAYSNRSEPILLLLAVAASRYSSHRSTSLVYMIVVSLIVGMIPVLYSLGLTSDVVKHLGAYTGHSWGFFNPNVLAGMVMCGLFAAFYYFKVERLSYLISACWIAALVVGFVTLCRSVTFFLFVFPLFYAVIKNRKGVWHLELLPVIMLIVTIAFACYFGPVLGDNSFISRFSIPYYVYEHQGVSLLGGNNVMETSVYVDNYILHYILNSGILVGGLLLAFYCHLLYRVSRRNSDPLLVSMIFCVSLFGFFP